MLEVKGLKKTYKDFSLSIDLQVGAGETLALVGPSGSGKTTALGLIAGLAEPDSGSVIIDGEDITRLPAWKRNISVVFQDLALFPHLDVGGNIAYGLFIRGVPKKERRRIVEQTLEIVRLQGYAQRRIDTLSGGERQRAAIARSLASSPRALLLDEPFSSLDAPLRKNLRRDFLEIRKHSKAPCIFVTHDREEALMLGDKSALMKDGRIVETAAGRDLLLAPKTEFAALFFGAGQVLPCRILKKSESGIDVSSPLGALTIPYEPDFDHLINDSIPPKLFVPEDAVCFEAAAAMAAAADAAVAAPMAAAADAAVAAPMAAMMVAPMAAMVATPMAAAPAMPGHRSFNAQYTGSLFEGKNLVLKFLLEPLEGGQFNFEISVGARMNVPEQNAVLKLFVNQNLLRLVKAQGAE